ncbi:MAG: hypothetical protein AB8G22_12485 [Saprospiraceae bacterium]
MKIKCLVGVLFLIVQQSYAQSSDSTASFPKTMIHWSVAESIHLPSPTFMLGIERRFNPRIGILFELGRVDNFNGRFLVDLPTSGIKSRLELRNYFSSESGFSVAYWAIQLGYNEVDVASTETFCRDNCNYFERIDYTRERRSGFLNINFGAVEEIWERLHYDVSIGAGVRVISISDEGLPTDVEFLEGGFGFNLVEIGQSDRLVLPNAYIGLRLGYLISK